MAGGNVPSKKIFKRLITLIFLLEAPRAFPYLLNLAEVFADIVLNGLSVSPARD
jgi:hypothetical protein